jgi:haloacetate dehalogenase
LIGGDPEYYLRTAFYVRNAPGGAVSSPITPEAFAEYLRCFRDPATIHATCEDYRASASIDLEHDEADLGKKLASPLLVIPGEKGRLAKVYDMPALWRERAENVRHHGLPGGHFLPEETSEQLAGLLRDFFTQ